MPTTAYLRVACAAMVVGAALAGPANLPKSSDVCFTSRSAHYTPVPGGLDTWAAAAAFHATRLDWVYTANASFINEAHSRGYKLTAAMNANLPDPDNASSWQIGRIENIHGDPVAAPWMRAWKRVPNYGCVNKPEYRANAFQYATNLLKAGADVNAKNNVSVCMGAYSIVCVRG